MIPPTAKLFELCNIKLADGKTLQMMWPDHSDHCVQGVQGSDGAKLHKDLIRKR